MTTLINICLMILVWVFVIMFAVGITMSLATGLAFAAIKKLCRLTPRPKPRNNRPRS